MKKLQRRQGPVHDHDFRISREITTFGHQRPLAHAKWTFQKHFRCADAHCGLGNDSQSSSAVLYQLKLEE